MVCALLPWYTLAMNSSPQEHAVERLVDSIASGAAQDALRNQLRQLDEAVSKASAMTISALPETGMLDRRGSWAEVYSLREREIRSSLRGELSKILSGLPKERFRVLATEHAPDNVGRYFHDLKDSAMRVLAMYQAIAERGESAVVDARSASSGYLTPHQAVLHGNVLGFLESLAESAKGLSVGFAKIIGSSREENLANLARVHDLLAEGLEDYTIAVSFAEKSLFKMEKPS